jgi:hypothetical protein
MNHFSYRGNSHKIVCVKSLSFYITGIESLPSTMPSTMKYSQAIAFHVSTYCLRGSEHSPANGIELEIVGRHERNDAAPDPNVRGRTVAVLC